MKETAYVITDTDGNIVKTVQACRFIEHTAGFPILSLFRRGDKHLIKNAREKTMQVGFTVHEPLQGFDWPGYVSIVRTGEELHWTFSFVDSRLPELDDVKSSLLTCEHELHVLRHDLIRREKSEQELADRVETMSDLLQRHRTRLDEQETEQQVEQNVDAHTGALKKEVLEGEMNKIMQEAAMASLTVVVVRIDLNDFRRVRDSKGQEACNRILRLVAKSLVRNTRGRDRLFRYGPDEFVLLMVGITESEADTVITRLEKESRLVHSLGFSWGMAEWDPDVETVRREELLRRADQRLQVMKSRVKSF